MDEKLSRRDVLQKSAAFGVIAALGAAACGKDEPKLSCGDTARLSSADVQLRETLGYTDNSSQPGKDCVRCQQFVDGLGGACGTCKVLRGPINPSGYCKSFAPKV